MNSRNNRLTIPISESIQVGPNQPLLIIAGPCQIESLEHSLMMANALKEACAGKPVNLVFKASFDKANRTSIRGTRGPGLERGLDVLDQVKNQTALPVITDVHTPDQARIAAGVVDVLQIPAFLCRQTDLLLAAGVTGKAINIKKGQFLHPADMAHVTAKVASTGNTRIMLCERGSSFGYRDLIVDMRSIPIMAQTGYPVVFDATHSVQSMGGSEGHSGGKREFIAPLARAAVAAGVDGVFIECHDAPERAPSDSSTMLRLEDFSSLLNALLAIRNAASC